MVGAGPATLSDRLVAGLLVVALPIMIAIVVVLTRWASDRLVSNSKEVLATRRSWWPARSAGTSPNGGTSCSSWA